MGLHEWSLGGVLLSPMAAYAILALLLTGVLRLGLQRIGGELVLHPCLPREWTEYELRYRFGSTLYVIAVEQRDAGAATLLLAGMEQAGMRFPLVDDGSVHRVDARWPRAAP